VDLKGFRGGFSDSVTEVYYKTLVATADEIYMKKALTLASRPKGSLLPNPRVGAVIVKNGKVLGEGYHRGPGRKHAEVEAVKNAKKKRPQKP
jgi:pyrimidine deaminase RibD-like protein